MHRFYLSTSVLAGFVLLMATSDGQAQTTAVIDFEGLSEGQIVSSLSSGNGVSGDTVSGSVSLYGDSSDPAITTNAAILFDSTCTGGCTGGDDDLFKPALGFTLIMAEDLVDSNGDGLIDDPDDADLVGAAFEFDFVGFGTGVVTVDSMSVLDFEGDEAGGSVELFSGGPTGTLLDTLPVPVTGDNGLLTMTIDTPGVDFMVVTINGSGAIDNVQVTVEECGDGIVQTPEECDDGNQIDNDGCTNACTLPECGDGIVQAPEECDDGNSNDNDGCTNACTLQNPVCGDNIVNQPAEQCDGTDVSGCDPGMACLSDCTCDPGTPICGDGVRDPGELCDGNDVSLCATRLCQADCSCVPEIFRDPARIIWKDPPKIDIFKVSGRIFPSTSVDPTSEQITFRLSNATGVIWEAFLLPGDCVGTAERCKFTDRYAKKGIPIRHGVSRFVLRYKQSAGSYFFILRAFEDMSLATDPAMTFEIQIGDERFAKFGNWASRRNGWVLSLATP